MVYEGLWGGWGGIQGSNEGGFYPCAAQIRFEGSLGGGTNDDTAANGLRVVYCHHTSWFVKTDAVTIDNGHWGHWSDLKWCSANYYMDGAQVRFEDWQGSGIDGGHDDTALNGLKIRCRGKVTGATEWITVHGGLWGSWKPAVVRDFKYIKMFRMRIERPLGGGNSNDDTSWNGLKVIYEDPNDGMSLHQPSGRWTDVQSGPHKNEWVVTESIVTTNSASLTTVQQSTVKVNINAGMKFLGVGIEAQVDASYSKKITESVSSTITISRSETHILSCPPAQDSSTGQWFMWQWKIDQEPDSTGPGYNLASAHIVCTPNKQYPPRCPLGSCTNSLCQQCEFPFEFLSGPDIPDPPDEPKPTDPPKQDCSEVGVPLLGSIPLLGPVFNFLLGWVFRLVCELTNG